MQYQKHGKKIPDFWYCTSETFAISLQRNSKLNLFINKFKKLSKMKKKKLTLKKEVISNLSKISMRNIKGGEETQSNDSVMIKCYECNCNGGGGGGTNNGALCNGWDTCHYVNESQSNLALICNERISQESACWNC